MSQKTPILILIVLSTFVFVAACAAPPGITMPGFSTSTPALTAPTEIPAPPTAVPATATTEVMETASVESDPQFTPTPTPVPDPYADVYTFEGWARVTFPMDLGTNDFRELTDVAYIDEQFFAVGFGSLELELDASIWRSIDGLVWKSIMTESDAVFGGEGEQQMRAITDGARGIVVVGEETRGDSIIPVVWWSNEGETWRRVDLPTPADDLYQSLVDVTQFGNRYYAVGVEENEAGEIRGMLWTSINGRSWTRFQEPEGLFGDTEQYVAFSSILAHEEGLIIVGNVEPATGVDVDGAVWTSTDGRAWERVSPARAGLEDVSKTRYQFLNRVQTDGETFVIIGGETDIEEGAEPFNNIVVWDSSDGERWTRRFDHKPNFAQQWMYDMAFYGDEGMAVGQEQRLDDIRAAVWSLDDGVWEQLTHSEIVFGGAGIQRINAVSPFSDGLIGVGITEAQGRRNAAVWLYLPARK